MTRRVRILPAALCALALPVVAPATVVIVDNAAPAYAESGGGWGYSSNAGYVGDAVSRSRINQTTAGGTATATWTPDLPSAGTYDVYAWWVPSSNRAGDARFTINHAGGSDVVLANQKKNGGQWNLLGRYAFNAGTGGSVVLADDSSESGTIYVSADALRFELVASPVASSLSVPDYPWSTDGCAQCTDQALAGALEAGGADFYIVSDMPEKFNTQGVLYSTMAVLPEQASGYPTASARTQSNNGFTAITGPFEVFLFHVDSDPTNSAKRIVILAENAGASSVTITPDQVISTDGIIGTVHQMESDLGIDFLAGSFDATSALGTDVLIPAGERRLIGYSKRFASDANTTSESTSINCFGLLRAAVSGTNPQLHVHIVALDEAANASTTIDVGNLESAAAALLSTGAGEDESLIDFDTVPTGCTLRRSTGVFPRQTWRSATHVLDLDQLPGGAAFQMGLDSVRTVGCSELRQSSTALLHPPYVRGDEIGLYHKDIRAAFHVVNSGATTRSFSLEFGKTGADIGLVYQVATAASPVSDATVDAVTPLASWAGPNQSSTFKTLTGTSFTLDPGEERHVALRLQVLGNSSTPFTVRIPDTRGPEVDVFAAAPTTATTDDVVALQFVASEPLAANPAVTLTGDNAVFASAAAPMYSYDFTVAFDTPPGPSTIVATSTGSDGNAGSTTTVGSVTITGTVPVELDVFAVE